MNRLLCVILCVILLNGCVSQNMTKGLNNLVGKHIRAAVERLGYPDAKREMLGDTIYLWGKSQNTVVPMSSVSTTTGSIGSYPMYGTTTSTNYVPVNYNCTIQIIVDSNEIIKSWSWSGNMGGCSSYATALTE